MSNLQSTFTDQREEVDLEKYPTVKALVTRCSIFFREVQNLYDPAKPSAPSLTKFRTPGHDLENYLNEKYEPGQPYYEDFCKYVRKGIEENEGWYASIPIDGDRYRRSRVSLPKPQTSFFSITTVFMGSREEYRG